ALPPSFVGFHWHGDVYDLPTDAIRLASSELTECQAFRFGSKTYGILCHLEITRDMVNTWVESFADELRSENLSGAAMLAESERALPPLNRLGRELFARFAASVSAAP